MFFFLGGGGRGVVLQMRYVWELSVHGVKGRLFTPKERVFLSRGGSVLAVDRSCVTGVHLGRVLVFREVYTLVFHSWSCCLYPSPNGNTHQQETSLRVSAIFRFNTVRTPS